MATKRIWIYLIKDRQTGCYKIGKSIDPAGRIETLRKQDTKQPVINDYELIEAWWTLESDEKRWHGYFSEFQIRGEWFTLSSDHLAYIFKYYETYQPYIGDAAALDVEEKIRLLLQEKAYLENQINLLRTEKLDLQLGNGKLSELLTQKTDELEGLKLYLYNKGFDATILEGMTKKRAMNLLRLEQLKSVKLPPRKK